MKLKTIIKDIIKEEVSKQISLTEAFKSSIMAKIDKAAKNTEVPLKRRGANNYYYKNLYKQFSSGLAKLGINASDITNDQFTKINGAEAKKYMKDNPEEVLFFLTKSEDKLWAVMKNNRHVTINPNTYGYNIGSSKNDPKYIRNTRDKQNISRAYDNSNSTGRLSLDDKTGLSRYGRSDSENLYNSNIVVYALTYISSSKSIDKANSGKALVYTPQYEILNRKRYVYRKQIEDLRSIARQSKENKELVNFTKTALDLTNRGLKFVEDILKNPDKYDYKNTDKEVSYGSGRDRRTYVTSFPKLFVELQKSIKRYSEVYDRGEQTDYEMNKVKSTINDIEKILTKFNF